MTVLIKFSRDRLLSSAVLLSIFQFSGFDVGEKDDGKVEKNRRKQTLLHGAQL